MASPPPTLTLQLYPLTGEIRLLNNTPNPFQFIFYEIKSPNGGLNGAPGVWTSIANTYDKPPGGNGFVDMLHDWTEISATPNDLAEGSLLDPGGTLPPYRSIGLGKIWNPTIAPPASLVATLVTAQNQPTIDMDKELFVDGDFHAGDYTVDQTDYAAWKILYGATNQPFADWNHDGTVDAADYTIWRDNLGAHYAGPGLGGGSGSAALMSAAVPEPNGALLAVLGACSAFVVRRCRGCR
jgi:hypothetical protein